MIAAATRPISSVWFSGCSAIWTTCPPRAMSTPVPSASSASDSSSSVSSTGMSLGFVTSRCTLATRVRPSGETDALPAYGSSTAATFGTASISSRRDSTRLCTPPAVTSSACTTTSTRSPAWAGNRSLSRVCAFAESDPDRVIALVGSPPSVCESPMARPRPRSQASRTVPRLRKQSLAILPNGPGSRLTVGCGLSSAAVTDLGGEFMSAIVAATAGWSRRSAAESTYAVLRTPGEATAPTVVRHHLR